MNTYVNTRPQEDEMSQLTVRVFPFRKGRGMGNIIWPGSFPMYGGKFPKAHPVGGEYDYSSGQYGKSSGMDAFRERGYWASCFPEGDGITWEPKLGQSDEKCLADIRECFGWTADWDESVQPEIAA